MTEQLNFTPSPYAQDRFLFVSENRQSVEFLEGHISFNWKGLNQNTYQHCKRGPFIKTVYGFSM